MKKILILLLASLLLVGFVSCNSDLEDETETSKSPVLSGSYYDNTRGRAVSTPTSTFELKLTSDEIDSNVWTKLSNIDKKDVVSLKFENIKTINDDVFSACINVKEIEFMGSEAPEFDFAKNFTTATDIIIPSGSSIQDYLQSAISKTTTPSNYLGKVKNADNQMIVDLIVPGIPVSGGRGLSAFPEGQFNVSIQGNKTESIALAQDLMTYMPLIPTVRTISGINISGKNLGNLNLELNFKVLGFDMTLDSDKSQLNVKDGIYLRYKVIENLNTAQEQTVGVVEYYYKWDGTISYRQYIMLTMDDGAVPGMNDFHIYTDGLLTVEMIDAKYDSKTKGIVTT